MIIRSWRLVKEKYVKEAFSGEGAREFGGRWNSRGTGIVYTSQSLALAALEILAGGAPLKLLGSYFKLYAEFDSSLIEPIGSLPKGWNVYPPNASSKGIGDEWAKRLKYPVLKVPSTVIAEEFNYLINPIHPKVNKFIKIGAAKKFKFDERLVK